MQRMAGDGVFLAVHDEGQGAPVMLLHGFPDSSQLWRHQIPELVRAGLRVLAPDLRGFGGSDKPDGVEEYRISRSVADVVAVLDGLGIERVRLVGHDWGAAVAWALASAAPDRVERLVAMSVGHPNAARERTVEDREKAWYMLLFQFPEVAETLLARDDFALLREFLRGDGDVERYVRDFSEPGALTAGLSWYRANAHPARELQPRRPFPPVTVPTLGVWSSRDHYLREEPMRRSGEHVTASWRYERIEDASHWMALDAPEQVSALLVDFLS